MFRNPADHDKVNLRTIPFLQEKYPSHNIGFSDHIVGIPIPIAAASIGAQVIEKHITIYRRMKGSDQAPSLGPDGICRLVRDIRILEQALG